MIINAFLFCMFASAFPVHVIGSSIFIFLIFITLLGCILDLNFVAPTNCPGIKYTVSPSSNLFEYRITSSGFKLLFGIV